MHYICTYKQSIVKVAESYLTLCDPSDCSLPGSSVHGILQARILEWVAYPFSRGFLSQGSNQGLLNYRQIQTCMCAHARTHTHTHTKQSIEVWNQIIENTECEMAGFNLQRGFQVEVWPDLLTFLQCRKTNLIV